jgi:hypothetical protein
VARIRARMHRNAWCAGVNTDSGRCKHRWNSSTSRISDRRNLVDVYGEPDHR